MASMKNLLVKNALFCRQFKAHQLMAVRLGSSSGGLPPNPAPWNYLWRNERKSEENITIKVDNILCIFLINYSHHTSDSRRKS